MSVTLWASSGGSLLATVTFTNETASGWQEMALPAPVHIDADTTYIASIFSSPVGNFSITPSGLASAVDNPPLRALAVRRRWAKWRLCLWWWIPYKLETTANYWVDVVFDFLAPDTTPPVISNVSAAPGANGTAVITWDTDEPADSLVDYGTTSGVLNLKRE